MTRQGLSECHAAMWARAQRLSSEGDSPALIEVLKVLVAERPDVGTFAATYANEIKHSEGPQRALPFFTRAVELDPGKEIFSLGLFHCLWELAQYSNAKREMDRFLSVGESKDYEEFKASKEFWAVIDSSP
ncbi:tetratricopeptide repeat protein [Solimonas terrae]|uniref:Tetratricopeptide repeat protein n=1 Tax=Solimonas terrae TaxID=1396819 RepID=A0A6M2BZ54_9GAMM|nr:tetratricopeptide repeat protein [Solimonas terrae]NGY07069.1 tetratricopeptide repeat protein [Solimonas terrae]